LPTIPPPLLSPQDNAADAIVSLRADGPRLAPRAARIRVVAVRVRWALAIAVGVALAAAPAARATLVFVRSPLKPQVWVARDDGSGQRRVAPGMNPRVSPDGLTIAYMRIAPGGSYRPDLMVAPADGSAPPHRLMAGWREPWTFAWSPDSATIAAVRGPELGRKRLVLIDVASGVQRIVARGYFNGASFSPQNGAPPGSGSLVYARAGRETFPTRSDLYRFDFLPPGVPTLVAEFPHRLTRDHRSLDPLWGPATVTRLPCEFAVPPCARPLEVTSNIVFVKLLGAKRRRYGPKNELYLMDPDGEGVRRLTHTRVGPLLSGLTPTGWSANGKRLLAEFVGQDTSYAVEVNAVTGAQHRVGGARWRRWIVGTALSADGGAILGSSGSPEPTWRANVVSVPWAGGGRTVLARRAFEPDWNR
jgi:hypothetical protein